MTSTNITTFPGKVAIGSNVFIDDTASNKLVITGSISTTGTLSGDGSGIDNIQTSNVVGLTDNVARIGTLETDLGSNVTRIETLETDLGSNATRIGTLETDLGSNVTRIETLETDLGSNATRIGTLETDLGSNVTRIETLETDLGSNVTRIETLETDLGSNVSRIETLETDLGSNVTRIETLESGETTITGIKTFQDDVILESNLRVQGDVLVANTVNMTVSDPILELGSNNLNTGDIGVIMSRHGVTESNVAIFYDESEDILKLGYTLNGANDTTIELDSNALAVAIQGNLEVGTVNLFVDTTTSNVGIGTDAPAYSLDVVGDINLSGDFYQGGSPFVSSLWTSSGTDLYYNSGSIGISNAAPDHNLSVGSNLYVHDTGSNVLVVDGNVSVSNTITTQRLTLNNVSISTTMNLQQVTDVGNVTSNTVQFTNPTTAFVTTGNVEVGTANLFVDTTTSNVGIRTNNPQATLHVGGTDGIIIPSGTTAQRPTGQAGMIRFNTSSSTLQIHNGTNWTTVGGVSATGGTVTTADGYNIHTFSSSDNFVLTSGGTVEYLIVAGGGGAPGRDVGGGGGSGGMLTGTCVLPIGTYAITVGPGGLGIYDSAADVSGMKGSDSSIGSLFTAIGGGAGKPHHKALPTGDDNGGSGGGGAGLYDLTAGTGISGQGNNGGNGAGTSVSEYGGGGGGGAGQAGSSAANGRHGGDGIQSSISGTATYYAGGGGGAGHRSSGNGTEGDGGLGGGGPCNQSTTTSTRNGTDGLGGGGGASRNTGLTGGSGGDGIVIIRYLA